MSLLDDDAVNAGLRGLAWDRQGDTLVKVVKGDNFADALAYVNRVGQLAEEANHHPDIDIRWNTVTLRLSTHDAGGLTDKDLALAARIDAIGGGGAAR
jgi:4a-hydroxytetrahydrobiopterin dehydratase